MRRGLSVAVAGVVAVRDRTDDGHAFRIRPPQSPYLVELDAVVLDGADRPVAGLRQEDFQIKEDGRVVEVKTFDAIADTGRDRTGVPRSIVLLLDDSGVGAGNTLAIQTIARMFVSRMAAA